MMVPLLIWLVLVDEEVVMRGDVNLVIVGVFDDGFGPFHGQISGD